LRQCSVLPRAAGQLPRHPIRFQRAMQPGGPPFIRVAVAEEGPVAGGLGRGDLFRHSLSAGATPFRCTGWDCGILFLLVTPFVVDGE
jgi:hypothetical protein